jgi:hypothetical protein
MPPLGMNWTRLGHQHAGEIQASLAIVSQAGQLP